MTKVKICGITNLQDALVAADAGADFLGFIFYPPSRRAVDAETAVAIIARLRERPERPGLVGVFVNETAAHVAAVLDHCRLDLAQLSGDEPPAHLFDADSPLRGRAYKALRPSSPAEAEADAEWYGPESWDGERPSLLLDAYHPALYGGTGQTADWSVAAGLAASIPGLMLAGGLTPDNVAGAVAAVRPWAVDVASGVEAAPGRKDHKKVRAFVRLSRGAEEQGSGGA